MIMIFVALVSPTQVFHVTSKVKVALLIHTMKDYKGKGIQVTRYLSSLNTAQSCSRNGPATAWLTLERPEKVMPVPKISTLLWSESTLFLEIKSLLL